VISPFNYGWAALGVVALSIGSWVFGYNHGASTTADRLNLAAAEAISVNVDAVNQHLIESRAETERIRAEYLDYKTGKENETSELERAFATGAKRLLVKATCPDPVRAAGAVPSGAGEGTAELTEAAERSYMALRRGLDRQYAELQFCRSELRKRSAR
jgi:hypothetical protein